MGWSLPCRKPNTSTLLDGALLAAGKALYLANLFESKCKFVLRIGYLGDYVTANPGASLDDAIASIAKDKFLRPTLDALRKFPIVSEGDVEVLYKACDARNFIAHEGAAFGYVFSARANAIREHLAKLRSAVADLANGDNIVSRWEYEIEMKEPASRTMRLSYPAMIDAWIFEAIDEIEEDDDERPMTMDDLTAILEARQSHRQAMAESQLADAARASDTSSR